MRFRGNRYQFSKQHGFVYRDVKDSFNGRQNKVRKELRREIVRAAIADGYVTAPKPRLKIQKRCWACGVRDPHKPLVSKEMKRKPP